MKYLKKFENTEKQSKFKEGDYVKYLYDMMDDHIINHNDFFIVKNVTQDKEIFYYKLIKIDKYFNFTIINNLDINEKNIELYHPTEEEKNEVELKLNAKKYNL